MTRKEIITTLAVAEHARNISALHPALNGVYADWLSTVSAADRRLIKDYAAASKEIARRGAEFFEKWKPV